MGLGERNRLAEGRFLGTNGRMDISKQSVRDHYGELLGVGSGWMVEKVEIDHEARQLSAWVRWRENRRQQCPECGRRCPGYDRMEERKWRHLDACGYTTLLYARIVRCECKEHGVIAQRPPWAQPGSRYTLAFEAYVIEVLKQARSVSSACRLLRLEWESVHGIRERAVRRGLRRRQLEAINYLGVDEKSFGRGHSYGTVVSDLEAKRVLEVVENREELSLQRAYGALGPETLATVQAVAMDLWRPYVKATQERLPQAVVVHDKFHVSGFLGAAVDQVRRREHRELQRAGDETLTGSKYLWLMDPSRFSAGQQDVFATLLSINLKAGKAWGLKETFLEFWQCTDAAQGLKFFTRWHRRVKRSGLKPLLEAADKIERHLPNILTYFRHRITNAASEGLNSFIQGIKANARGFRNFANYRIAILFYLGKLDLSPFPAHTKP